MFSPGQEFAGYRIVRVLGAGGMGEVYLARHPRLPREDALKVLPAELTDDPTYRARFIREADLAAGLDHPSIVSVYDRGEDRGQLWITMKYIPGSDANELMKQTGPFAPGDVVEVITAVADALDCAHGKGLLHRDVKPANILIDSSDTTRSKVYLTDFGIARTVGNETALTAANLTVGSIQYTSPEQLRGGDLSGRADQYSLACTAFRLLTGRAPYPERKPTEIINAHLNNPIPRARVLRPDLPPEVDAVLTRGMDKTAVNRYPTCLDFARDLGAALHAAETRRPTYQPTMINPGPVVGPAAAPPVRPPQPAQRPPTPQPGAGQCPPVQPPQRPTQPLHGQADQPPHGVSSATPQYPAASYPPANPYPPAGSYPAAAGHAGAPGYGNRPPYGGPPTPPPGTSGSGGGRGRQIALIVGGIVVVAALAVGTAFTVNALTGDDEPTAHGPSTTTSQTAATSSTTATSTTGDARVVNGVPTQCVNGAPAGTRSITALQSGDISIPAAVMPRGWQADSGTLFPFVTGADGVVFQTPPAARTWVAQIAVGSLPSTFRSQTEPIARKMVDCLSTGPGYATVRVGPVRFGDVRNGKMEDRTTDYTLVNAQVPVLNGPAGVTGDEIVVVVIDSSPMTVAIGISPTGDTVTKAAVDRAVNGLRVR